MAVFIGAGLLIEFLPVDLAIVLIATAAMQAAIWSRIVWQRLQRRH